MLEKNLIGNWIQATNSSQRIRKTSTSSNNNNNFNSNNSSLLLLEPEEELELSNFKRVKPNNSINNKSNVYYEEERIEYQDAFSFEGYSALANSLGLLHLVQKNSMEIEENLDNFVNDELEEEEEDNSNSSSSHNSSYSTLSYSTNESITTPPTNSVTASPQLLPILNLKDLPKFDLLEFNNNTSSNYSKPPSLISPIVRRKTLDLPNNNDFNSNLSFCEQQSNLPQASTSTSFSFATFEYSNPSISTSCSNARAPQSTPIKSTKALISPTSLLWRSNLPSSYIEITPHESSSSSSLSHPEITSSDHSVQFEFLPATKRRRI